MHWLAWFILQVINVTLQTGVWHYFLLFCSPFFGGWGGGGVVHVILSLLCILVLHITMHNLISVPDVVLFTNNTSTLIRLKRTRNVYTNLLMTKATSEEVWTDDSIGSIHTIFVK